jgi:hypothetical protein
VPLAVANVYIARVLPAQEYSDCMSHRCYRSDRYSNNNTDFNYRFNHLEFESQPVKIENTRSCLLRFILLSSVLCIFALLFTVAVVTCHGYSREIASLRNQLPVALRSESDVASMRPKSTDRRKNEMTRRLVSSLNTNGSASADALQKKFPSWFRIRADGQRILRTPNVVLDLVEIIGSLAE